MPPKKQPTRVAKKNDQVRKGNIDGIRLDRFQTIVMQLYKEQCDNQNDEEAEARAAKLHEFVSTVCEEERETTARVFHDHLPFVADYRNVADDEEVFSRPTEPLDPMKAVTTVSLECKLELETTIAQQNAELKKLCREKTKLAKQGQELGLALAQRVNVDDSGFGDYQNPSILRSVRDVEI